MAIKGRDPEQEHMLQGILNASSSGAPATGAMQRAFTLIGSTFLTAPAKIAV